MPYQKDEPIDHNDLPLDAIPFPELCKKLGKLYAFPSPSDCMLMCDIIEELANRMRTRGYTVHTSKLVR